MRMIGVIGLGLAGALAAAIELAVLASAPPVCAGASPVGPLIGKVVRSGCGGRAR